MADIQLTPSQVAALTVLIDEQMALAPKDQKWAAAYKYVADAIRGTGVTEGVQYFFDNAGDTNANSPTAASSYFIRTYYTQAAAMQEVTLSTNEVNAVSGNIGAKIFDTISKNGFQVSTRIEPIVDLDISPSV